MNQKEWIEAATEYSLQLYGVTVFDLGYEWGDEAGESPDAYVERMGEKFGLLELGSDW